MLQRNMMTETIADIPADATLMKAAETMKQLDIGAIQVREDDRLVGIITERDITVRAVAEGRDPMSTPVREAMSRDTSNRVIELTIESRRFRIQSLAYLLWQKRGSPLETPDEDWFEAERVLSVRPPRRSLPLYAFGIERSTS